MLYFMKNELVVSGIVGYVLLLLVVLVLLMLRVVGEFSEVWATMLL
jgi:hypothetical protein